MSGGTSSRRPYKTGIYVFAICLLAVLALLKWLAIDATLFKILAISSGVLVAMLLMTYRAFEGVAEAARNAPQPTASPDDDEDEDEK